MKMGNRLSGLIILIFFSLNAYCEDENLSLTVEVSGATPGVGQIILALYSSSDEYLRQPLIKKIVPINEDATVTYTFPNLPAGTYSVSAVYDEDSNGVMNTGLFRIPTELVGFSNNVKSSFGPPSFEKTSFPLSNSKNIHIRLGKAKE